MSVATYSLGLLVLAAVVAPLIVASTALRRRFLPDWVGPRAALATTVVFLALLEGIAQLVGTFGLLRRVPLIAAVLLGSGIVVWLLRRQASARPVEGAVRPAPTRRSLGTLPASTLGAVVIIAAVALPWLARTLGSLRTGVLGYDSLDYHLPFAGRFFQTGDVSDLYFTFTKVATAFHPADAELVHAIGMLGMQRDVLSPVINLGWLALALGAAWCTHTRRDVQLLAVAGVGVLVAAPLFTSFAGGRATNDLAALALFLSAVALVLSADGRRPAVALAAVAAGLAVATKLTMVVPVLALTAGVIAIALAGSRRRTAATWLPWLVLTGGYWYVRNLVAVGNPVPALQVGLGPVSLPSPTVSGANRSFAVVHYLTDVGVWRSWFLPGLRDAFGLGWPIVVGLAIAGWATAAINGDRIERMLAIVGVVAFAGYLVTPASAGGVEGRPVLFASDTRFALPALALGLLLIVRLVARSSTALTWVAGLLALGLLSDLGYAVKDELSLSVAAMVVEAVALGIVVALFASAMRSRRTLAVVAIGLVVVGAGCGLAVERSYLDRRYAHVARNPPYGSAPRVELAALYAWVDTVSHARIALNGTGISYPFFGADLSNRVDYIGHRGNGGDFDEVSSCREWRTLLNEGHYDYVVIAPDAMTDPEPVTASWTAGDPAADQIVDAGKASVFRVTGRFDEDGCPSD